MNMHLHKFKYLSKERSFIETSKFSVGIYSYSETVKEGVTYVRSVCIKCGRIKTQTIPGNLTLGELVDAGLINEDKGNR